MKIRFLLTAALASCSALPLLAAPLTQSTFTEVVREVSVVEAASKTASPAEVNEVVKAPDLVRTGAGSRAELTAPDQTITRVGANTVFSFEPAGRDIRLEKGSLLFHSPAGKGGGTIRTGGASAAVLGTTIIVVATEDGGFKVIVLEGRCRATLPDGRSVTLRAGQMIFVLPGDRGFSQVLDINLGRLVAGSLLINGFAGQLASRSQINAAVEKQNEALATGKARDTGMSVDAFAAAPKVGNGLSVVDHTSFQTAVHPPLTPAQLLRLIGSQGLPTGGPGGSGAVIISGPPPNPRPPGNQPPNVP